MPPLISDIAHAAGNVDEAAVAPLPHPRNDSLGKLPRAEYVDLPRTRALWA